MKRFKDRECIDSFVLDHAEFMSFAQNHPNIEFVPIIKIGDYEMLIDKTDENTFVEAVNHAVFTKHHICMYTCGISPFNTLIPVLEYVEK
jgi:hypothetical protein